ncbi:pyridoxal phosphate-dependent decarboxylase family protein [Hyphobacterium sp.]|uniref:pyridoxal phosphate-dependent decarboxylase family protein n=1 Tax=Hyphobacterium sp. TaxID=2004662 RepID=UPI003BAAFB7A
MSETLDPENWDEVRASGHRMLGEMIDYLASVDTRPAWRTVPEATRAALDESVPRHGEALDAVFEQFRNHILPYPTGNLHPGFFGWVMGNGTATGMLADMLASGMNAHVAGYDQSAAIVERQVIGWLAELVGYPSDASGLLVTGGTMANLNGLAVARHETCGFDIRERGLQGRDIPRLRIYGSTETHSWIYKACELMGMGRSAFRAIPVNDRFEIDLAACRDAIKRDIAAGDRPICLIGTAGTVNTGAIDDFAGLRSLADEFGLWLHIDGAFGSLAAWNDEARPLVAAQNLSDSIAFDLHKWGYMPYDVGCVLTRSASAQDNAFAQSASYLSATARGPAVGTTYFADKGVQLSRSFRALKVWMSMKEQGVNRIGRIIGQNIRQARYLADRIAEQDDLELLAPVSLNIVCLRYVPETVAAADLDALNTEILLRVQESGEALPSHTRINGKFAIRVCISNHRTTNATLDALIWQIRQIGAGLAAAS